MDWEAVCSSSSSIIALYVEDSIRKSSNKSCSLDPIPTWLVKELVCELMPFVTELFNKSISEGYFPKSFRIGEITPILKKASLDPSIITNYRPVSNLSFLSKLLERTINKQLLSHLNDNDLLPEYQSAYRSCHSTETALLKVTSDALTAADRGMITILGFLDLSAAFDCVDHQILMTRLERTFGISCSALVWIKSYLEGRTQRVRYNGAISAPAELSCGVPLGSVLGPLYFLLYTADVFQIAHQQGFKIHGYADDLQLYQHCLLTDVDMMKDCFSMCVERIMAWMSSNRLRLNASKTEILWLGSSRRLARTTLPSSIVIDNCSVPLADEVKCLGVTIDSALTFSKHVSSLVRTCYFQLCQLRSIRKSLTVDTCHALVRSLIISRLDYCNGIPIGAPADLLNRLDGVLRGAAHLILKRQRSDHNQWFDAWTVALVRHQIANRIQDVSPCLPLSEWLGTSVSCHRVHSRCWSNRTIASSLRCFRGCYCASMPDTDNRSSGFRSCLPQGLELSPEAPPQAGHQPVCFQERTQDWVI